MTRPVYTELPEYRTAVAELSGSLRLGSAVEGAIVVVSGTEWVETARRAQDEGAVAVVVDEPGPPTGSFRPTVPVVVSRRRKLSLARLGRPPALVTVEATCDAAGAGSVLRDALGYARELAAGRLRLRTRQRSSRALSAYLTTDDGLPVSVVVSEGRGWLRVCAYGAEEVEVEVDDMARTARRVLRTSEGARELPVQLEIPARRALRETLVAMVAPGDGRRELADACADAELAHALLEDPV